MGAHDRRNDGGRIDVRRLAADDVEVVAAIDRSEHLDTMYEVVDGELIITNVDIDVPT